MNLIQTSLMAQDLANELTVTPGLFFGADVRLFTNDVLPTENSLVGDFDAPTYVGYAPKAITWLDVSITDDGEVEVIGTLGEFRPTNAVTPNSVFGAFLHKGGTVLLAGRFDDGPLPMESAMDAIVITVRFRPIDQSIAIVIS